MQALTAVVAATSAVPITSRLRFIALVLDEAGSLLRLPMKDGIKSARDTDRWIVFLREYGKAAGPMARRPLAVVVRLGRGRWAATTRPSRALDPVRRGSTPFD
jgi:hypothetical protein